MTKMLKTIAVVLALAVTAGASASAIAGPHNNPSAGLYPDNYWGK